MPPSRGQIILMELLGETLIKPAESAALAMCLCYYELRDSAPDTVLCPALCRKDFHVSPPAEADPTALPLKHFHFNE